eukprot:3749712-Amphidinium_carterae.1
MKPVASSTTSHLTHAICVVKADGEVDLDGLRSSILDGTDSPPFFAQLDALPPHDSQVLSMGDGLVIIHLHFRSRVQISKLSAVLTGEIFLIDQSGFAAQKVKLLITYMFLNMGGRVLSCFKPAPAEKSTGKRALVERTPAEIDAGFNFINKHAPTGFQRNQHLVWMEKELRDTDSPIFEWDRMLVREAMRNKQTARCLADEVTSYPVCLADLNSWVVDKILKKLVPMATEAGFVFLGKAGCGKTPLANSLAMAISGHQIARLGLDAQPSFRTSNNLDFFRGEPGETHIPFIWDDGDVCKEDSEAVKGFLDVPGVDPKIKARWGASAFSRLQSRILISNKWDESAEPSILRDGQIPFQTLLNMVAPTFSSTFSREDVLAVLKRANLAIFGNDRVYVRPGIIGEAPVAAFPYPSSTRMSVDRDLIADDKKENLKLYRSGSDDWMVDPAAFRWGVDFVTTHIGRTQERDELVPAPGFGYTSVLRDFLPPATDGTSSQMGMHPAIVDVKQESQLTTTLKRPRAFSRSMSSSQQVAPIELDSSPEKMPRMGSAMSHQEELDKDLADMLGATPTD